MEVFSFNSPTPPSPLATKFLKILVNLIVNYLVLNKKKIPLPLQKLRSPCSTRLFSSHSVEESPTAKH